MSKIFAKHMEAIKEAETFIANNIGLDTVSLLVEYGRSKYVTGRDSGFRKILFKTVNEKEDPLKPQRIFEITEGGYVKHHNEVGIRAKGFQSSSSVFIMSVRVLAQFVLSIS